MLQCLGARNISALAPTGDAYEPALIRIAMILHIGKSHTHSDSSYLKETSHLDELRNTFIYEHREVTSHGQSSRIHVSIQEQLL